MEPLRLGIIGTGSVVREIYRHLYFHSRFSTGIEVVAACDIDEDSLSWFCDTYGIPQDSRYRDYSELLARGDLDAVAVNTPDSMHREPVIAAMKAGCDVIVPKPIASRVSDAYAMLEASRSAGRFLGVDFHKRGDPVVREARARFEKGAYGSLQIGSFYMLDRLLVSDPNHEPRFFASPDFAARNSPISFLTSHMTDTLLTITGLYPHRVTAIGYRQKLRSLSPIPVEGYDTVATELVLENGASVRIVSGWILPNTAPCLTVQSAKLLFTDGELDLWNAWYGFHEVTASGINDRNVLFMNFDAEDQVSGYGISHPGSIIEKMRLFRDGAPGSEETAEDARSPVASGLLTALVCEAAQASLDVSVQPQSWTDNGVVAGATIDAYDFLAEHTEPAFAEHVFRFHR